MYKKDSNNDNFLLIYHLRGKNCLVHNILKILLKYYVNYSPFILLSEINKNVKILQQTCFLLKRK